MKFIRFNPDNGHITSIGDMNEEHIDQMLLQGEYIRKTPDMELTLGKVKVLLPPCGIPPLPDNITINYSIFPIVSIEQFQEQPTEEVIKTYLDAQITAVSNQLADRAGDPLWDEYLAALTTASQQSSYIDALIIIPDEDPDGKDWFRNFWQFIDITPSPPTTDPIPDPTPDPVPEPVPEQNTDPTTANTSNTP